MDELLTVSEVASRLKCCRQTVYNAVERGQLRCNRIGRSIRISVSDLTAYLTPASESPRQKKHTPVTRI